MRLGWAGVEHCETLNSCAPTSDIPDKADPYTYQPPYTQCRSCFRGKSAALISDIPRLSPGSFIRWENAVGALHYLYQPTGARSLFSPSFEALFLLLSFTFYAGMRFLDLLSTLAQTFLPYLPTLSCMRNTIQHDLSFNFTTCDDPKNLLPCLPTPNPLPLELVTSIIQLACFDGSHHDETLLRHCALVCRAWSFPAQKMLFSRVTLRTRRACTSFHAAVTQSTMRGRMFRDAVIRLKVVLDHNHTHGVSELAFGEAFKLCPNLHELDLALYGHAVPGEAKAGHYVGPMRRPAPTFDEHTLSLLKSGPKITSLHFSNWSDNHHSLAQLLPVWPTLKSLVICGTPPQTPSSITIEPLACSLEHLRMNFQTSPSIDFMNWLLHNSSGTLRILEFDREPLPRFLDHLTDRHGAGLHALSVPLCTSQQHTLAIQKCPQLRELCIEDLTTCIKTYRKIFQAGTLEHIALGLDRNTILYPIIEIVRSSNMLKMITVNVWHGGDQHPQFSTLKVACAYRGVELRITKDIQVFRLLTVCSFQRSSFFMLSDGYDS